MGGMPMVGGMPPMAGGMPPPPGYPGYDPSFPPPGVPDGAMPGVHGRQQGGGGETGKPGTAGSAALGGEGSKALAQKDPVDLMRQLGQQEEEMMRGLESLPKDSELYNMRMEHARQMVTLRCEIEKTMQERTLEELKQERERVAMQRARAAQQDKWAQEQKRALLESEVRRRLAAQGALKTEMLEENKLKYEPSSGFYIYWDFVSDIPMRFTSCRLVYAFYDGATAVSGAKASSSEQGKSEGNKMVVVHASHRRVTHMPPVPHLRLVVEVQNVAASSAITAIGWAVLELFDHEARFKTGRFALPLFRPPPQVTAGDSVLRTLETVTKRATLYLRIGFAERHALDVGFKVESGQTSVYSPPPYWESGPKPETPEPPPVPDRPEPERDVAKGLEIKEEGPVAAGVDEELLPHLQVRGPAVGLGLHAQALMEFRPASGSFDASKELAIAGPENVPYQVLFSVYTPHPSGGLTGAGHGSGQDAAAVWATRPIVGSAAFRGGAAPGAQEPKVNVTYNEIKRFEALNAPFASQDMTQGGMWLVAKVLARRPSSAAPPGTPQGSRMGTPTRNAPPPTGERVLVAWSFVRVPEGCLSAYEPGQHQVPSVDLSLELYPPPASPPPYSLPPQNATPLGSLVLTLYDPTRYTPMAGPPKPPPGVTPVIEERVEEVEQEKVEEQKEKEVEKTFIPHSLKANDVYYDPSGDAFDLYVDAVRFPPYNALASRLVVRCVTNTFKLIFSQSAFCVLDSPSRSSHVLKFHFEYRAGPIDPTALLIMRLDVLDRYVIQEDVNGSTTKLPAEDQFEAAAARAAQNPGAKCMRTCGFSMLNIFSKRPSDVEPGAALWPDHSSDQQFCLNSRAFQLPVSMQSPQRSERINASALDKLPKLVGTSLLVRIVSAPKSKDGLKLLSVKNVEEAEWVQVGLKIPPPAYGPTPVYDTSRYEPTRSETNLLKKWEEYLAAGKYDLGVELGAEDEDEDQLGGGGGQHGEVSMRDELIRWKRKTTGGKAGQDNDEALQLWMALQFGTVDVPQASMQMLNFDRALVWDRQHGLNVAIDCVHKLKKDMPVTVIHCLSPPGGLYLEPKLTEDAHFTTQRNWDSPVRSPLFKQNIVRYRPSQVSSKTVLVLDVRWVDLAQKRGSGVSAMGWTILPLFDRYGFFQSGSYQLPLFEGPVLVEFLEAVKSAASPDPWDEIRAWMRDKVKMKKLKPEKWGSIFVRATDAQRDSHYIRGMDFSEISNRYINPADVKNYAYEKIPPKTLEKIKPKKSPSVEEYEKEMNMAVAKETEISRYVF